MIHYVHHRNGEIVGVEDAPYPSVVPNTEWIKVEDAYGYSPLTHKVTSGALAEKTPYERYLALIPTVRDLKLIVRRELHDSDYTQLPTTAMADDLRERWRIYREALGMLNPAMGAELMVDNFPPRPDGVAVVDCLRERFQAPVTEKTLSDAGLPSE